MAKLNDLESTARDMLDPAKPIFDSYPARAVRSVFWIMYHAALPAGKIQAIAHAAFDYDPDLDVKPALAYLVRAGVLRSRLSGQGRVWELNFPE